MVVVFLVSMRRRNGSRVSLAAFYKYDACSNLWQVFQDGEVVVIVKLGAQRGVG